MLFDLGGKRKRFIQVIYVFLALLLGGGLVLFGIGGDANGGLADLLGFGSNSSGSTDSSFEKQIDKADETLASNPEDEKALLSLARYQFLSAQEARGQDEQGQFTLTEDSLTRYGESIDAWERYLATKPDPPDDDVASLMVQAYQFNIDTTSPLANEQLEQLVIAAGIVADARPSYGTYVDLLTFAYISGDDKLGAVTAKKAEAEAADSTQRKQVAQVVKQAKATRIAIQQQIKGTDAGAKSGQLPDPTAGLGGSSQPVLPSSGTTP